MCVRGWWLPPRAVTCAPAAPGFPTAARSTCGGSARLPCATSASSGLTCCSTTGPIPTCRSPTASARIARLREEGKVRFIGVSEYSVAQLDEAQSVTEIASTQNQYSLAHRQPEQDGTLAATEARGLAFIPVEPTGRHRRSTAWGARPCSAAPGGHAPGRAPWRKPAAAGRRLAAGQGAAGAGNRRCQPHRQHRGLGARCRTRTRCRRPRPDRCCDRLTTGNAQAVRYPRYPPASAGIMGVDKAPIVRDTSRLSWWSVISGTGDSTR